MLGYCFVWGSIIFAVSFDSEVVSAGAWFAFVLPRFVGGRDYVDCLPCRNYCWDSRDSVGAADVGMLAYSAMSIAAMIPLPPSQRVAFRSAHTGRAGGRIGYESSQPKRAARSGRLL